LKRQKHGGKKRAEITEIIVEINDLRELVRLAIGAETGRLAVFKQAPDLCVAFHILPAKTFSVVEFT
jgi:hypothetical protein